MKTLLTALALATLIVAPAFTKSAAAARARDATSQWEQNYNGYYRGYPLEEWYRTDGW